MKRLSPSTRFLMWSTPYRSWTRRSMPKPNTKAGVDLGIDTDGRDVNGVVVARVLDVVPHPDADRIRLADVDFGAGQLRVVCGAPNIEPGMVVPFARVGAVLPGDFKIERRKIRGVVSEGMLCSARRELGLGNDHDGILSLPDDAPLGTDVREVLGLDDVVFDVAIPPDRPDAMGIAGVAADLAAHFGMPFALTEHEPAPILDEVAGAHVVVEALDRCPRFVAVAARVVMGPSPTWMQRRLTLAGMRPISNVVDVTNYVMLRVLPTVARVRPRPARRARDRRAARVVHGREDDHARRCRTHADERRSPHLRRGAGTTGHRGDHGRRGGRGLGTPPPRSSWSRRTSSRAASPAPPNGSDSARRRVPDSSAASTRTTPRPVRGTLELFAQVSGRSTGCGRDRRLPATHQAGARSTCGPSTSTRCSGPRSRPRRSRSTSLRWASRCAGAEATVPRSAPTSPRDRSRRGSGAPRRSGQHRRTVPSNPEKIGGLSARQRDRRTVTDVLVGAGYDEVFTLPLLAPLPTSRTRGMSAAVIEVENPLAGGVDPAPGVAPGRAAGSTYNYAAHGEPDVALFESGTVFTPPAEGETLPHKRRIAGVRPCASRPHASPTNRTVRSTSTAQPACSRPSSKSCGLPTSAWRQRRSTGSIRRTRAAQVLVDSRPIGFVGEVASSVVDAAGAGSLQSWRARSMSTPSSAGAPRRAARPVGVALSRVVDRPRLRRCRHRARRRVAVHLGRRRR